MRFINFENRSTINLLNVYFDLKFHIDIFYFSNLLIYSNQFVDFIFNLWKVSYFPTLPLNPSSCVLIFDEMHNLQKLNPKLEIVFQNFWTSFFLYKNINQ